MKRLAQTATPAEPTAPQHADALPLRFRNREWATRSLDHCSPLELARIVAGNCPPGGPPAFDEELLFGHSRAGALELARALGLPFRAALRVACAFELGRRASARGRPTRAAVRTPRDAFELVHELLLGRDRETVVALYLDGRHRLLQRHEVSIGTATASLIHPREVFGPGLRLGACALVIAHNHPSGDPEPSAEDRGVTERLQAAGELVGIPLLDHIVVGGSSFVSLRGRGAWPPGAGATGSRAP